jgi:hypothetical protein
MFGGCAHSAMPPVFCSEQLKNQLVLRNRVDRTIDLTLTAFEPKPSPTAACETTTKG